MLVRSLLLAVAPVATAGKGTPAASERAVVPGGQPMMRTPSAKVVVAVTAATAATAATARAEPVARRSHCFGRGTKPVQTGSSHLNPGEGGKLGQGGRLGTDSMRWGPDGQVGISEPIFPKENSVTSANYVRDVDFNIGKPLRMQ